MLSSGFFPVIINVILIGTFDWRTLALTSSVSFLLLLILIFILVTCGCWSELHHKKVKNVNLAARRKIDLLVSNNWDQLLEKAKQVLDCRLADGMLRIKPKHELSIPQKRLRKLRKFFSTKSTKS